LRRRSTGPLQAFDFQPSDLAAALGCIGYLTRADARLHLKCLARSLIGGRQAPLLLDVGCGTGGYGLWLATQLRAQGRDVRLLGVDASVVAIGEARARAQKNDACWARFECCDFAQVPLVDESATAIVSLDALYLAPNRLGALAEMRRLLGPGGILLFTAFEPVGAGAGRWKETVRRAGFEIDSLRDITKSWRRHMTLKHRRRLLHRHVLVERLGEAIMPELEVSAHMLGSRGRRSFVTNTMRYDLVLRRSGR
jgi:SAM-dependent methyltransferase